MPSPVPSAETRSAGSPWLAMLCLIGAVIFWGMSFMATKTALEGGFSPMTVVWLRLVIACLVLAPFWARIPKPDYRRGDIGWLVLVCLLQPGIYYLCENYAIGLTTSSQAGVISALVPLLVAAGAWVFLHEHISARTLGGIALSIGGVAALSLGATAGVHAPNPVLGNVLEVVAMVSAAGSMIALKHLVQRYDPWMLTGIQALAGVALFLPGALASNPRTWLAMPASAWWGVAYLGAFVSLGAFGLYAMALRKLPASRAALAINAVPVVALITGWLVLGESLGVLQAIGCVAIATGVALGQSFGGQRPEIDTGLGEG
ncbi:MAG: DMT family transporter [Coriobacteriia bacterium]|nr:DMT family transporter [Coriobacteriia bacterium]